MRCRESDGLHRARGDEIAAAPNGPTDPDFITSATRLGGPPVAAQAVDGVGRPSTCMPRVISASPTTAAPRSAPTAATCATSPNASAAAGSSSAPTTGTAAITAPPVRRSMATAGVGTGSTVSQLIAT